MGASAMSIHDQESTLHTTGRLLRCFPFDQEIYVMEKLKLISGLTSLVPTSESGVIYILINKHK